MSNRIKSRCVVLCAACLIVPILLGVWVFATRRSQPEFYRRALAIPAATNEANGQLLERRLVQLHNNVRRPGFWSIVLEQTHINGWLASDLPEKFPPSRTSVVQSPRIDLQSAQNGQVELAFKLRSFGSDAVVQVRAIVLLTETPNQIVFQIEQVQSGWLLIPMSSWADALTGYLTELGAIVEWTERTAAPVMLVTLPRSIMTCQNLDTPSSSMSQNKLGDQSNELAIELLQIEIMDGSLEIRGRSQPIDSKDLNASNDSAQTSSVSQ